MGVFGCSLRNKGYGISQARNGRVWSSFFDDLLELTGDLDEDQLEAGYVLYVMWWMKGILWDLNLKILPSLQFFGLAYYFYNTNIFHPLTDQSKTCLCKSVLHLALHTNFYTEFLIGSLNYVTLYVTNQHSAYKHKFTYIEKVSNWY